MSRLPALFSIPTNARIDSVFVCNARSVPRIRLRIYPVATAPGTDLIPNIARWTMLRSSR